ncbi:MAG: prepilin-type N-terminal cleavage/methylation domain-containing protein [Candidatus Eremiobacteraeota bacterium]|nr:prepilin-type N-terminal cleavage/methylation domain-containing protein [Candidatus Eremiobacteraeota bacterium]
MCRETKRGFSLLEMMFAVALFALLMIMVFAFFQYATRSFQLASVRQGIQSDGLRVMNSLQGDLRRTAESTITLEARPATVTVDGATPRRDAISVAGLYNWNDASNTDNFDPGTGQPRWNRYIVYYATRNEEGGHLYKLVLEPAPPPVAPVPLPLTELQDNSKDDPSLNIFQGGNPAFVQLARNVQEFSFENKSGTIVVHLTLRERRGARPNSASGSGVEVFELVTAVRPENTYPSTKF